MTSIVHMTSAHSGTDVRIFHKMARSQAARGWSVTVIAPITADGSSSQTGKRNGVTVDFFADPRLRRRAWRATFGAMRVTWRALKGRPDMVQAHDPELIPFLVLLRLFGIKTIFDAHEDFYAQNQHKDWTRGVKRYAIQGYARLLLMLARRFCWHILAATDGVARAYPAHKTTVVRNYPIKGELGEVSPDAVGDHPNHLAYIGGISEPRGIKQMLDAIVLCSDVTCLELAGKFETPALEAEIRAHRGWDKVKFHGYLDRDGLKGLFGRVKAGLVLLHPTPNHLHSIPVKLMEYYSVGLPVIASDFLADTNLVVPDITGLTVAPLDVDAIAAMMQKIMQEGVAQHLAQGVSDGPQKTFVWQAEADHMNGVLSRELGKE